MVEKDLKIGWLLDFYSAFLTRNQKSVLDLYYNMDYSLAEIAEKEGITRQGVLDTIQRGTSRLKFMEDELKLYEKYSQVLESLKKCRGMVEKMLLTDRRIVIEQLLSEINTAIGVWEDDDGV